MPAVDLARYHGWHGKLQSPWWACLAVVRTSLLQVFRRKAYWIVLGAGFLQFLMFWAIIYGVTQLDWPEQFRERVLQEFGFRPEVAEGEDDGYVSFMNRQNLVVMILLAFSGSLLVGSDFRQQALPFYLSRRIDRQHYIVGKLLAISTMVALLTVVPALLLFLEFGMFTSSFEYWRNNWRVPIAVLSYGAVLCVVNSLLLAALSAWLERAAPIAITWTSLFAITGPLSFSLFQATDNPYWRLLDPWRNMRLVGRFLFGTFKDDSDRMLAPWAALILGVLCAIAWVALVRRVRAVDIVE